MVPKGVLPKIVSRAPETCSCSCPPGSSRKAAQIFRTRQRLWRQQAALDSLHSCRRNLSARASPSSKAPEVQRPQQRVVGDWAALRNLQANGEAVEITIEKVNRTAAIYELHGVQGYIPYSLMDNTRLPGDHDGMALEYLVGKQLAVKVVKASEEESQLVVSEIALLTQQMAEKLREGDVVEGVVSSCRDFGAFVRLGAGKTLQGVEGLIHISELSWNKIFTPEAVVQPGMIVRCKVLSADPKSSKITLSLKRMEDDPLDERLETIFDSQTGEKLAHVPPEVPSSIEDVVASLQGRAGIDAVSLGRQAEERRAVSQDLEIWMSTAEVEGGYALIARAGRLVQEIRIQTSLSKADVRSATEAVLKELSAA